MATTTGLVMAMAMALPLLAAAAPQGDGSDPDEGGRLQRVSNFVKSYALREGAGMVTTDDDVKCLVQAGQALSSDKPSSTLTAPVINAVRVLMRTSPLCKLNVLAKGRLFLSSDFLKGLSGALFGSNSS